MSIMNVPQFVPSSVCLGCDGCCRFKDETTSWRAKIGSEELNDLHRGSPGLLQQILDQKLVDSQGFIKTITENQICQCHFFDLKNNSCRIYGHRPFECALYPFILHRQDGRNVISVHLNCPHIQENKDSVEYKQFLPRLKSFFLKQEVLDFLTKNKNIIGDYSDYKDELETLWTLPDKFGLEQDLIAQRVIFENFQRMSLIGISAVSFANIFSWQDFFTFDLREEDGKLAIYARDHLGVFQFCSFLGRNFNAKDLETSFQYMENVNGQKGITRIDNVALNHLAAFPKDNFRIQLKGYEYLYRREDLATLSGGAFKSQRHAYNHFKANYHSEFLKYESSMQKECLELFDRWASERKASSINEIYRSMLDDNRKVHARILASAQQLDLVGRVVKVDKKIVGYTFGYPINTNTFCVFVEVADLSVKGLPAYIFCDFCRDQALSGYEYINTMDDFELENVKQTKLSYNPIAFTPMYTVTRINK